jgi:ABC-type antimicrobial peptide transport system permease subunit
MAALVDGSLAQDRFLVTLLTVFSSAALWLAAIGLYALVSYQTARRHREIGIRLAVGASRRQMLSAIVGESLLLAGWGAAVGLTAGWFVTHLLGGMLHGVQPHDPLTWVAAIVLLAAVAVAASYGPARRAASVDPAVTLRQV